MEIKVMDPEDRMMNILISTNDLVNTWMDNEWMPPSLSHP